MFDDSASNGYEPPFVCQASMIREIIHVLLLAFLPLAWSVECIHAAGQSVLEMVTDSHVLDGALNIALANAVVGSVVGS